MSWFQASIELSPRPRGFHLITSRVVDALPELRKIKLGLLHVFIQHTSASLTINENADPDVPVDLEMSVNKIVPETFPYIHTLEGPDDMPAHVRSALTSTTLSIPVVDGAPALGTWQGIYLYEHRTHPRRRRVVAHLLAE